MWLCGYVGMSCGNVASWLCGYVAMWLCELCGYSEFCAHPVVGGRLLVSWSHMSLGKRAGSWTKYVRKLLLSGETNISKSRRAIENILHKDGIQEF